MLITMLIVVIILSFIGINVVRMQKEDEARRKRKKEIERALIRQKLEKAGVKYGHRMDS